MVDAKHSIFGFNFRVWTCGCGGWGEVHYGLFLSDSRLIHLMKIMTCQPLIVPLASGVTVASVFPGGLNLQNPLKQVQLNESPRTV